MRQMTDKEVLLRAEGLKKRHRSEWCQLVYEACVGRSMQKVADLMGCSKTWVNEQLKRYALESASGGGSDRYPLMPTDDHRDLKEQVNRVVTKFAPAEPEEEYLLEYETEGHTPEVAKCLALAYEAGENAIEAGVLQETVSKTKQRASQIVMPSGLDWDMRLRSACAAVKSAAGLLDRAKIADLRRAETRKQVEIAHAKWMEQIERIENFHPTFDSNQGGPALEIPPG